MDTLHIAPTSSAGGAIAQALREAGRDGEVIMFEDDLSCGSINPLNWAYRIAWWRKWHKILYPKDTYDIFYPHADSNQYWENIADRFWEDITETDDHLIVWFSRHSASEFCFYLALAARLGARPFYFIDVAGRQYSFRARDGSTRTLRAQSASELHPNTLKSFFGQEIPISPQELNVADAMWQRLRAENAPFRVVTDAGCESAPIDYFDTTIVAQASLDWKPCTHLVGDLIRLTSESYRQVGEVMLRSRIVALVEQGRLLSDGDLREKSCRIRLPPVT